MNKQGWPNSDFETRPVVALVRMETREFFHEKGETAVLEAQAKDLGPAATFLEGGGKDRLYDRFLGRIRHRGEIEIGQPGIKRRVMKKESRRTSPADRFQEGAQQRPAASGRRAYDI